MISAPLIVVGLLTAVSLVSWAILHATKEKNP